MTAVIFKPSVNLHKSLAGLLIMFLLTNNSIAAVILQYHHVSNHTPRTTSLSIEEFNQHMQWLENNQFSIIPLPQLITKIKQGKLNNLEKIASISFDDTGETVCQNAAPLLLKRKWPFTIFINTEAMHGSRQCSWKSINKLQKSGLLTIGNHSHSHLHMLDKLQNEKGAEWLQRIKSEILKAEEIIEKNTGEQTNILAYPYGEYNQQIQQLVKSMDYTAVGQQSGAVGNSSDLTALPRFPLSGVYANMDTISTKLLSLPFPIKNYSLIHSKNVRRANNAQEKSSLLDHREGNAPLLKVELRERMETSVQCFLGNGERISTTQTKTAFSTQYPSALKPGRNRYNCTAASALPGRFYWYSQQWVQSRP